MCDIFFNLTNQKREHTHSNKLNELKKLLSQRLRHALHRRKTMT